MADDETPTAQLREWLEQMLLIRAFEETAEKLSLRGRIPGGIHAAVGQEAVAVGVMSALRENDVISSTHRSHHHALAKGLSPDGVMAELYARRDGVVGGRGGSMHLASFPLGHYGGNGIVGAGAGIAMGVALGIQHRRDDNVAVGFVGDGGVNVGRLWEAVNLAAIWSLPLVVVVENNQYAVETHVNRVTGGGDIVRRAAGFGVAAERVDGQDVVAVHRMIAGARDRAVSGAGPTLVEAVTYRYYGHNTGEVARYRTQEEIADWRSQRDPIDSARARLVAASALDDDGFAVLETAAHARVEKAVAFAEASPQPDPKTAADNVDAWDVAVTR
ncbi:thiamine pyrophosphate-dependent dehydrogenase E1 component subunit alpha [Asanoa sp. NPDC049573]|uniref:thiamine pyrophosphate-dependent dehydrogenase E1 component subunit alpha n=1 Tax=Asanoa sp. NPDC049573 TaxID=3155396 RepID=UPI003441FF2D